MKTYWVTPVLEFTHLTDSYQFDYPPVNFYYLPNEATVTHYYGLIHF